MTDAAYDFSHTDRRLDEDFFASLPPLPAASATSLVALASPRPRPHCSGRWRRAASP